MKTKLDNTTSLGTRDNAGKPRWSLVDFDALEPMVRVLEFGAQKYGDNNWKKGLKTTEICESLLRHIIAYLNCENNDSESKLPHIGHILCNAMFLSYMTQFRPDCDTRHSDINKQPNTTKIYVSGTSPDQIYKFNQT